MAAQPLETIGNVLKADVNVAPENAPLAIHAKLVHAICLAALFAEISHARFPSYA